MSPHHPGVDGRSDFVPDPARRTLRRAAKARHRRSAPSRVLPLPTASLPEEYEAFRRGGGSPSRPPEGHAAAVQGPCLQRRQGPLSQGRRRCGRVPQSPQATSPATGKRRHGGPEAGRGPAPRGSGTGVCRQGRGVRRRNRAGVLCLQCPLAGRRWLSGVETPEVADRPSPMIGACHGRAPATAPRRPGQQFGFC